MKGKCGREKNNREYIIFIRG